jgi:putative ABC transport system permease protein
METVFRDLRFALRTLRGQPAFSVTVVATLALAIGASTAIFSVVESTLLRGLPFRSPDRVGILSGVAGPQRAVRGASIAEVQDWGRLNRVFEVVAIYDETSLNLQTTSGAERVDAEMVSASYFDILGASAQIGRTFTADEDRVPDANAVVTISDGMWRGRFGAAPDILGRTLILNERPFVVIGVMKPGFKGISFDTDVWFPSMMARANGAPADFAQRGNRWLEPAVGRLRPGVTLEQAQRDLDRVAAQLAREYPESNADRGIRVLSLRDSYLGSTRQLVLALFGAVGLLLLIACTNVVALQLVRASRRVREIALRISIGAGRARIIQQLVVEALVLAVASAVFGLGVASWVLQGLVMLAPPDVLPPYATPSIDFAAFLFALLVAATSGVVFGVAPALQASRLDLISALKEGARGASAGIGRGRRLGSQQLLVVSETAVAIVLLVGATLFVRSLQHKLAIEPGFDATDVIRVRLSLPDRYTPAMQLQFTEQLHDRLAATPTVRGVAIGSDLPLGGSSNAGFIFVSETDQTIRYYRHLVSTDYFDALKIPLVAGRAFQATDRDGTPPVVVIGQAMARRFWGTQSPLGKRLRLGDNTGPEMTVVGVVGDVRFRDLTTQLATSEPDVYFPLTQRPAATLQIAIRSTSPAEQITSAVRRELASLDATVPLFGVRSLDALLADQTAQSRFASSVLSVFGAAALVLTAVGLYGVLAFLVALRRREIGIRIALGAPIRRVVANVVGHGARLVVTGTVVGLIVAIPTMRLIEKQLYGVRANDPIVFIGVALALLAVGVSASSAPARRAARVDPQIVLREE